MKAVLFMTRLSGFTIAELLVTLALLGIIATFVIPKMVTLNNDRQAEALTRESFAVVGDAWLQRLQDSDFPDISLAAEAIGGANANYTFAQYLFQNLNVSRAINPTGYTAAQLCNTEASYFVLPTGTQVRSICSVNTTTPETLQIRVNVPRQNGTTLSYMVYIPKPTATAPADRYTTQYGFTQVAADCSPADTILRTVNVCP